MKSALFPAPLVGPATVDCVPLASSTPFRSSLAVLFTLGVFLGPVVASAQTESQQVITERDFLKSEAPLSLYSWETLSRGLPESVWVDMRANPVQKQTFDEETMRFSQMIIQAKRNSEQFKQLNEISDAAFELAGDVLAPDEGDPRTLFAKTGLKFWMGSVKEKLQRDIEHDEREAFRAFWGSRKADKEKLSEAAKESAPAYAAELLREASLPETVFDGLTADRKADAVKRMAELAIAGQGLVAHDLKQDEQRFRTLFNQVESLKQFNAQISTSLTSLVLLTKENADDLKSLRYHSAVIEQFLYTQLPLQDQLRFARIPGALGLNDKERIALEKTLNQRQKIVDETNTWNDFMLTGHAGVTLLTLLGANQDVTKTFNAYFVGANSAYSISKMISGGGFSNYVGAANLVLNFASLLAGGDPDQQRQQQIMQALQQILNTLRDLEKEITEYHKQEVQILRTLQIIDSSILQLHVADSEKELNGCDIFLSKMQSNPGAEADKQKVSYTAMEDNYKKHQDDFAGCQKYLKDHLYPSDNNATRWGLGLYNAQSMESSLDKQQFQQVEDLIVPIFNYIQYFIPTKQGLGTIYGSLYLPGGSMKAVQLKQKLIGNSTDDKWLSSLHEATPGAEVQGFYLRPQVVTQIIGVRHLAGHIARELQINSYREITTDDYQRLMTPQELMGKTEPSDRAKDVLLYALDWLNVAIAQQRLLSGDILLPYLANDAKQDYDAGQTQGWDFIRPLTDAELNSGKKDLYRIALAHHILLTNPLIRDNTARYLVYEAMQQAKRTSVSYSFAYEIGESDESSTSRSTWMNQLLGNQFQIDWFAGPEEYGQVPARGWYLMLFLNAGDIRNGGNYVRRPFSASMPSPNELVHGAFRSTPALDHLLTLRANVEGRVLGFDITENARATGRLKDVKSVILLGGRNVDYAPAMR